MINAFNYKTLILIGPNYREADRLSITRVAVQRLIGAANLSSATKLVASTGAVLRYKLSRSQEFITVQDLNCGQMCVSGCMNHYKFVLGAGAPACRQAGKQKP